MIIFHGYPRYYVNLCGACLLFVRENLEFRNKYPVISNVLFFVFVFKYARFPPETTNINVSVPNFETKCQVVIEFVCASSNEIPRLRWFICSLCSQFNVAMPMTLNAFDSLLCWIFNGINRAWNFWRLTYEKMFSLTEWESYTKILWHKLKLVNRCTYYK